MKKILLAACILLVILSIWSSRGLDNHEQYRYVNDYLVYLGQSQRDHYVDSPGIDDVNRGEALIRDGRTIDANGRPSKYISKYFKCVSCHNVIKEVDNLTEENIPASRLAYAMANEIPFLQASTFYGLVNKDTWYNDDYERKYGSLVEPARNSLKESIQLCAQECSQGRKLKDWEMKSILAYLWTLQLKMSDLQLTADDKSLLNGRASNVAKIDLIRSKYSLKNGATFGKVPKNKEKGYELTGNRENGAFIYKNSCQHCHRVGGESDLVLSEDKATFKWLRNNLEKHSQISLYEIIKKGTYAQPGHRAYMPLYSEEKISNQQVEDLRAYIEFRAG